MIQNGCDFQVPRLVLLQHQTQVLANHQRLANLLALQLRFLEEETLPCSIQHQPNLKLEDSLAPPLLLQLLVSLKQHKLLLVREKLRINFFVLIILNVVPKIQLFKDINLNCCLR